MLLHARFFQKASSSNQKDLHGLLLKADTDFFNNACAMRFLVSAAFLIVLHTWDHTSVVRCIWAAVERSEANAQSLEQLRSWHAAGLPPS